EHHHDRRDQQQYDPRSFERLRNSDDDQNDGGDDGADAVDRGARLPARLLRLPPVDDHSRLRQRERHTKTPIMYSGSSDCVQPRTATIRIAANDESTRMPFEKASRSP